MKTADFHFDLPESLIAQFPARERSQSRLLHLNKQGGALADLHFPDLLGLLNSNDLLVFNNTKVMHARLYGNKVTGGRVELLIERILDDERCLAHMRVAKKPKPGQYIYIKDKPVFELLGREGDLFHLRFQADEIHATILSFIEQHGHMPLPPYIDRDDESLDKSRYQTVYAKQLGAVAAPTAGLHFDASMFERIKAKGIETAEVTLHVGAGTFQPVKVEDVSAHHMHSEVIQVSQQVCDAIHACKARGGRVVAVGTTTVRALETAAVAENEIKPYTGDTDIFIYPGYCFKLIDALLTNFHLPESTLLMLISAFAGKAQVMHAYAHAVQSEYRFFSYGDAMLIS